MECPVFRNQKFFLLFLGGKFARPEEEASLTFPFGPVDKREFYFGSRHPFALPTTINPFDSLQDKIWMNYGLLYFIFVLVSISIYVKLFRGSNSLLFIDTFFSPSEPTWSLMFKSGTMLPCLVLFTLWTFNFSLGVDLWGALISK